MHLLSSTGGFQGKVQGSPPPIWLVRKPRHGVEMHRLAGGTAHGPDEATVFVAIANRKAFGDEFDRATPDAGQSPGQVSDLLRRGQIRWDRATLMVDVESELRGTEAGGSIVDGLADEGAHGRDLVVPGRAL